MEFSVKELSKLEELDNSITNFISQANQFLTGYIFFESKHIYISHSIQKKDLGIMNQIRRSITQTTSSLKRNKRLEENMDQANIINKLMNISPNIMLNLNDKLVNKNEILLTNYEQK